MALLDEARVHLRTMSEATDVEIESLISMALEDMRRLGVHEELLVDGTMSPIAKQAVFFFCKAHYGYDNSEASRFDAAYRLAVVSLMHSEAVCDGEEVDG